MQINAKRRIEAQGNAGQREETQPANAQSPKPKKQPKTTKTKKASKKTGKTVPHLYERLKLCFVP